MMDQDLFKPKPASEFKAGATLTWHCPKDGGGIRIGVLLEVCENSVRMFVSGTFGQTELRLNEVVSTDMDLLFSTARPEHYGYFSGLLMGAGFEYPQVDDEGTMVLLAYGADADDGDGDCEDCKDCDCEDCDHAEGDDACDCDRAEVTDVLTPIIRAGIHSHPTATLDACLESGMDVTPADVIEELGTVADEVPVLIRQSVVHNAVGDPAEDLTPVLEYADEGSSGMDVRAVISPEDEDGVATRSGSDDATDEMVSFVDIPAGGRRLIHTNIYAACPKGYELQVRPRSGLALKHGITVLNTPGTIDSSYRGEVGVILINHGTESFRVFAGDRIAQLVLAPIAVCKWYKVDELPTSDRDGGFGHTGVK